jgi:hypothetical protein
VLEAVCLRACMEKRCRIVAFLCHLPNQSLHSSGSAFVLTCVRMYVQERRRIATILRQPPNRPLHAEERAILWRFRFSLQQETRALTKFLQCVDWGDATEGRQVCVCVCEKVCVLCVYVDWGDATEGRQVCVCLYVCIYNPCKFCNVD